MRKELSIKKSKTRRIVIKTPNYHDYIHSYLDEVKKVAEQLDRRAISEAISILKRVRDQKGRLFILGVGGGAGNAGHAVGDFRKLAGMEAYAPTDNVSELTARTNDEGFETIFARWLEGSSVNKDDAVLVFSVGGGHIEKNISLNLVHALEHAKSKGARIIGIVGRDGGHTAKVADVCILIPVINLENVTAHTESFQGVIWHLIVFHPLFRLQEGKWESVQK